MATTFSLNIVRAAQRIAITGAFSPPQFPTLPAGYVQRPVTSPPRRRSGAAEIQSGLTPALVVTPGLPSASILRPVTSARPHNRGSARTGRLPTPAFTFVQSGGASSGSIGSLPFTLLNPVTAGDLIVVLTGCDQSTPATVAVSDNYGNTYANARDASQSINTGSNDRLDVWYSVVTAAGTSFTVTVTPSASNKLNVGVAEFAIPQGATVSVGSTAAGFGIGSSPAPGPLTLYGDCLVVASTAWGTTGGNPGTPGTGYSTIFLNADATVQIGFASEFRAGVTISPESPSFGLGGSTGWASIAIAFDLLGISIGPVGRGTQVSSQRRPRRGSVTVGQFLSTATAAPQVAFARSLVVRSPRKPRSGRVVIPPLAPAGNPSTTIAGVQVSSRRRPRRGSATVGQFLSTAAVPPQAASAQPLIIRSPRKPRRGSVTVGRFLAPLAAAPTAASGQSLLVRSPRKARSGSAKLGHFLVPLPPVFHTPLYSVQVARSKRDIRYRQRSGQAARFAIVPPLGAGPIAYHIYANTGVGDPINYQSPIGTTSLLTFTTAPLIYPGIWSFGVRAFDLNGEEQNLEASLTIVLSATGTDITNLPAAPIGLTAFATAGGGIRSQWTYPAISAPAKTPTGFHVYVGLASGPLCSPFSIQSARVVRSYSGSVWQSRGVSSPARSSIRRAGAQSWRSAQGGSPNYSVPVATVPWAGSFSGTFVSNLGPFPNGAQYVIGVRAFNPTAEEQNIVTVTATADSVGPAAVQSLTAVAAV